MFLCYPEIIEFPCQKEKLLSSLVKKRNYWVPLLKKEIIEFPNISLLWLHWLDMYKLGVTEYNKKKLGIIKLL
jgi:hypothetical protein